MHPRSSVYRVHCPGQIFYSSFLSFTSARKDSRHAEKLDKHKEPQAASAEKLGLSAFLWTL